MSKSPVFLERDSYRRRRLTDAIRFLPFLGLVLFMVPLLWPVTNVEGDGITTSVALRYLFFGWIFLALVAFGLWLRTKSKRPNATEESN